MGTLNACNWLENSVLDEIYGWETYLACPSEEYSFLKSNSDNELRLKSNVSFLDHWLDLNA
jgi:hypothetical protein